MSIPNHKHQAHAKMIAAHRKRFHMGLVVVIVVGAFVGYQSGSYFEGLLTTDPDHPGFAFGTWAALRETLIATFSLYGILIWPMVFAVIYWGIYRRLDARLAAQMAIWQEEARTAKIKETQDRIEAARERGEL